MKKVSLLFFLVSIVVFSQQVPDTLFNPMIKKSAYKKGKGSVIYIDQAHSNFHTKDNRFLPFARLLRQDGYVIKGFDTSFTKSDLEKTKILVISNALAAGSRAPFTSPTKSAFSALEIKELKKWVKKGGSLFLIADHMPFAGAASKLGKAFDFKFYDSFLLDSTQRGSIDFSRENEMLNSNFITNGRSASESVDKIRTFTGQAFETPQRATSILTLKKEFTVHLPDTMWVFNDKIRKFSAERLSQGAVLEYGKGRVAIFGEAAMFTAQLAGRDSFKVGMNAEEASENYKLLLNITHWLDRLY
jgi:hypothetical protein